MSGGPELGQRGVDSRAVGWWHGPLCPLRGGLGWGGVGGQLEDMHEKSGLLATCVFQPGATNVKACQPVWTGLFIGLGQT